MSRNARLIDRTSNSAAYPGIDGWCRIRRRLLLLGQLACYKEYETAFARQTRSVRITNRNKQVVDVVRCLGRRFQSHDACKLRVRTGGATRTADGKRGVEEQKSGKPGLKCTVFFCICFSLFKFHLSLRRCQVVLVAGKRDDNIGVASTLQLPNPIFRTSEGLG